MRKQLTPRQKKLAAGLGAVGLLALVYVWQADDENALLLAETAGSGQQTVSAGKEAGTSSSAEADKAKYQKIRGLESQTSLEELRNPFSPAHEKRGEAAAAEKIPRRMAGKRSCRSGKLSRSQTGKPQPLLRDSRRSILLRCRRRPKKRLCRSCSCAASCRAAVSRWSSCPMAARAVLWPSVRVLPVMKSWSSAHRA